MLNRDNLHQYQLDTVEFVKTTKKCALFLDMGLGKSISTLTALADLFETGEVSKVLVIAPLRVANSVWYAEVRKWEHTCHLSVAIATGSPAKRKAALESNAQITVMNQDVVTWLMHNSGIRWRWDTLVIDESHGFKSASSQRFKALKKAVPKINRAVLLTGTPSPNNYQDLWSQMYLLDSGERLGRTVTAYRSQYFHPSGFKGYQYSLNPGADHEIRKQIGDITLTLRAQDHIDMPERTDIYEPVYLPAAQMKRYKELEKDFYLQLEEDADEGIEAVTAGALAGKLLQFCNGFLYDEDKQGHDIHDEKIKALKELRENYPSENLLVAYNFKYDLELLTEAFPDAVVLDKEGAALKAWNRGEIGMLLAHPASAGSGLNLQEGGSVLVWYGLQWNLGNYLQFNARLFRQGQKQHVRIVHLVTQGCIDEKVVSAIKAKATGQQELINHLKLFNAEF